MQFVCMSCSSQVAACQTGCCRFVPVLGSELVRGKEEEALSREQRALVRLLCCLHMPASAALPISRACSRMCHPLEPANIPRTCPTWP